MCMRGIGSGDECTIIAAAGAAAVEDSGGGDEVDVVGRLLLEEAAKKCISARSKIELVELMLKIGVSENLVRKMKVAELKADLRGRLLVAKDAARRPEVRPP